MLDDSSNVEPRRRDANLGASNELARSHANISADFFPAWRLQPFDFVEPFFSVDAKK
jgi:hypothetical protein